MLTALDFATGKKLWSLNILKQNECGNLDWAMAGSPLVYDDVVLVNPGNQKGTGASRSIVAYDLADGGSRWFCRRRVEGQLRLADAGHLGRRAAAA